jgi:hypothetical protein
VGLRHITRRRCHAVEHAEVDLQEISHLWIALGKPIGGIDWARYKALLVVNFTVCCTSREILLRGVISQASLRVYLAAVPGPTPLPNAAHQDRNRGWAMFPARVRCRRGPTAVPDRLFVLLGAHSVRPSGATRISSQPWSGMAFIDVQRRRLRTLWGINELRAATRRLAATGGGVGQLATRTLGTSIMISPCSDDGCAWTSPEIWPPHSISIWP